MTGFSETGFVPRTALEILAEYEDHFSDVYEAINYSPGTWMGQLAKLIALREWKIEQLVARAIEAITIEGAYGEFLEMHGYNIGIYKKGQQYAEGHTEITVDVPTSDVSLYGTIYTSQDGKNFYNNNLNSIVPSVIEMIRTSGSDYDKLPSPYSNLYDISWANSQSDSGGTSYTEFEWSLGDQWIQWTGSTQPSPNNKYYIGCSGYITVSDEIIAAEAGTGYNVGVGAITSFSNNADLNNLNPTITNLNPTTGGTEEEEDEEFKERIWKAKRRNFTLGKVKDIVSNIDGIRGLRIYQSVGTDQYSLSDWSQSTGYTGYVIVTGNSGYVGYEELNQRFVPGTGIVAFNKVVVFGRRVGEPPDLICELYIGDSFLASGRFKTYSTDPYSPTGWQDLIIPIKYNGLDRSHTHKLYFGCADPTIETGNSSWWTGNYWCLSTGEVAGTFATTGELYSGTICLDTNMIIKTQFGGSAYNIDVALEQGYNIELVTTGIENVLSTEEGSGFSPLGIQYVISQCIEISIECRGTIFLSETATITTIRNRVESSIDSHLENLEPGEDVIYSKLYSIVMNDPEIWKLAGFEIRISGNTWVDTDIKIRDQEIAVLSSSWSNTNFIEG